MKGRGLMKNCRLALLAFSAGLFMAGNVQAGGGLLFLSDTAAARMTNEDFSAMTKAALEALNDPTTPSIKVWTNPKTGSGGTIKTTQAFTAKGGEPCKQVLHTAQAKGLTHEATSTVCKIKDQWKLVSEDFAQPPVMEKK
jgi:surface antigen